MELGLWGAEAAAHTATARESREAPASREPPMGSNMTRPCSGLTNSLRVHFTWESSSHTFKGAWKVHLIAFRVSRK